MSAFLIIGILLIVLSVVGVIITNGGLALWGFLFTFLGIVFIVMGILGIVKKNTKSIKSPSGISAGELKQLKNLLDSGAITQEEFDKQKQKFINQ